MRFNFGPNDIIGIVRRRFFWAAIPFLVGLLAILAAINTMPEIYESSAEMLVEDQQIRNEFVQSAVESDALQRVEAISARVLARDNLIKIANEQELYRDRNMTATQRFEAMRKDTTITSRRVVRSRRRDDASAISVRVAYRSPSPAAAQRVTNALLTDFQSRSVDLRTEIAEGTSDFMREQVDKTRRRLDEVGKAINDIKSENVDSLPENRSIYERALDRTTAEKARIESAISDTEQSIRVLELQRPLVLNETAPPTPQEAELQSKRRALQALQREFQDTYPDVISLKREVMALEREIDPDAFRRHAGEEIASLNQRMERLTAGSPEYARLDREKADLRTQLSNLPPAPPKNNTSEIQYNAQMQILMGRKLDLQKQLVDTEDRIRKFENQIAATPVVEGQLFRLEQERDQLQNDLSDLRTKVAEAERSESLEQQSKGERLSTIQQPTRPDAPVSPDKPRLAILGVAVAGLIAALFALVPEILFARVRSRDHLESVMGQIPIVEIPDFTADTRRKRSLLVNGALSLLTIALVGIVAYSGLKTFV